jgi:uncharacterized membrane-anchored protein YhcB (DUF1043 family)
MVIGLVSGLLTGVLLTLLFKPVAPSRQDSEAELLELSRRLEAAKEARERADRQLEQFQKLAEQMTASFQSLEARFTAMSAEMERRRAEAAGERMPDAP